MAEKGITIPVNFAVDADEFEKRIVKAASESGKEMEKKLNQSLINAFNVEKTLKDVKNYAAKMGHLPDEMTNTMFKNLESSAKKATAFLDDYNKKQMAANEILKRDTGKGVQPVFTETFAEMNKPLEEANIRIKEISQEMNKIAQLNKDISAYEDNKSIISDRSKMVDLEVDIIDKYEKQEKLLNSSIKARDTLLEKIRQYNAEIEKAHPMEIPNATNMRKWGGKFPLEDPKVKSFETRIANAQARMRDMQAEYEKAKELIALRDRLAERGIIDADSGKALQNLDTVFSDLFKQVHTLQDEENSLRATTQELQATFNAMPQDAKYQFKGLADAIGEFPSDAVAMNDMAAAFAATAHNAADAVQYMNEGITATMREKEEAEALREANRKAKEEKEQARQKAHEVREAEKQAAAQARAWSKAVSDVQSSFHRILGVVKKVISGLKQFGKQSKSSFNEGQPSLKKMFNLVLRFGFGIRSIFFLVKRLKKTMVDDFNVMAQSIPEVNKQLSELSTSWLKLKATLGTLMQPLLQFFGPAINWAINKIQELMIVWAKFIALLTGQKYIYTAQTAMVDYAESLGDAASAAKELNKQLAPFDKLNVLNSNDKGGGGGVGKPTEINTDNVKYLKEDLEDIDNIFYEMGKRSAQMFNDIMNSFDWKEIKEKAKEYAKDITDYIWGWVDIFDFAKFGQTIAEGINTIFTFIKTFVETMPWSEIGEGIGTSITNFFDTLDIETISDGIAGTINGAVNLVAGLLKETDFKKIGTKIGEFLSKTFKKINWKKLGSTLKELIVGLATIVMNTMKAIDWEDVGHGIRDCLEELFDGDPNPLVAVGEALWTCLQSAIELKHAMFDGHPIANFVTDALILLFTVGPIVGRLMNIGTAIMGLIGAGMKTTAATTAVSSAASTAVTSATAGATTSATAAGTALGGTLVSGILGGLVAAAAGLAIGTWLDENILDPLDIGIDNWYDNQQEKAQAEAAEWAEFSAERAVTAWNGGLASAAEELDWTWLTDAMSVEGHSEEWDELVNDIEQNIRKLNAAGVDLKDTAAVLEYIGNPMKAGLIDSNTKQYLQMISEGWDDLSVSTQNALLGVETASETQTRAMQASQEACQQYAQTASESLNGVSENYATTADGIIESNNGIVESTATALDGLTTNAQEQTSTLSTLFGDLKSTLRDVFNGIIGGSEKMGNGVADGINEVSESLNTFDFTLPDWLPGVGGKSMNFNIPKIGKITIPKLAQGGVIPANNEFLAVLGDQKSGTNIEAPLDTIKQAVAEVMAQMSGSSDNGDIIINIDGDEVFRVVRDKNNEYKKSNGKSAFA